MPNKIYIFKNKNCDNIYVRNYTFIILFYFNFNFSLFIAIN